MSTDKIAVLGVTGNDVVRLELNGGRPAPSPRADLGYRRAAARDRPARSRADLRRQLRRRPVRQPRWRADLAKRRRGARRPAGDVGRRVTLAPGVGDLGRVRRDGAEQPVSLNRRRANTGSRCRRCATSPASRSGRSRPGHGPITSARSRCTRPIPSWLAVGIELGGVMRSDDGGASWFDHNPQAHSDAHQLLTHPLAPDRLYEAAGQGIARSENLGRQLEPARGRAGPALRLGGGDRSRRPRPLVRIGQPRAVRRSRRRRRTGAPVALARQRLGRRRQLGRLGAAAADALRAGDRAGPARDAAGGPAWRDADAQRRRRRQLVARRRGARRSDRDSGDLRMRATAAAPSRSASPRPVHASHPARAE